MDATPKEKEKEHETAQPIVIDLGKVRKKKIRELKRGRGRLTEEVQRVVAEVGASLGEAADGKLLVPLIVVYRQKRKKGAGLFPSLF
ncbi:MAG TPA: hypothetical protein VGS22_20865 [Thermoanaerobaculia bacterium]|jgi:hypothetical protein|nr:hypothetical protein [Thermoanaerobaculia bacterium]